MTASTEPGQLGLYLTDGNVEWAGRNDGPVNIRGFRVELEEIEAILEATPGHQRRRGDYCNVSRLPLLIVSQNRGTSASSPTSPLMRYLRKPRHRLHRHSPHRTRIYMLPAYFVVLQSLPLSPNGKVDYRSLPSVQFSASVAPPPSARGEVCENKLREIFAMLLGRSDVGI